MFDHSFKRSALYFSTLQILRIFAQSIRGTEEDLKEAE
jgi:hypothetical protein